MKFTLALAVAGLVALLNSPSAFADTDEIALVQEQGGTLFEIPVRINGAITLNFILDSGASAVQIPDYLFKTLVAAQTIQESDLLGEQSVSNADGSSHKVLTFRIRELKIGHYVLRNILGLVGPEKGALLLGQSFLSHFESWTLDNKRHVLKLAGNDSETVPSADATPSLPEKPSKDAQTASVAVPRKMSRNTVVCGKPVDYQIDQATSNITRLLLGIWTGNWNNANNLCGALIVQSIDEQRGTMDLIYVYGPSRAGSSIAWKQQHQMAAFIDQNRFAFSFQDDQGSTFRFQYVDSGNGKLEASFAGRSGRLTATFYEQAH